MSEERSDEFVKMVPVLMVEIPKMVLKLGVPFLRMKKRVQKAERQFRTGLEESGMPPELARELSDQYAKDLSIRRIISGMQGSAMFKPFNWRD
jgi:hypothetical protein